MKVRLCYVSNSSSSSCIIISRHVCDLQDLIDPLCPILDFEHKRYAMLGNYLDEGVDYIRLNRELYEWIKEHARDIHMDEGEIFEEVALEEGCIDTDEGIDIGGCRIWHADIDYHSSESVDDLSDNYLGR